MTFFINVLFIIYKGSPQLDIDDMPFWQCFLISFGVSTFCAILAQLTYVPYVKKQLNNIPDNQLQIENTQDENAKFHQKLN